MDQRDQLLRLTQQLLSAPGSGEGWHVFLADLCDVLGGSCASFISHALNDRKASVAVTARTPVEAVGLYQDYWHHHDPWARRAAITRLSAGTVVTGDQLIPRHNFEQTEFCNDFGRHYDILQCITGVIEASPDTISVISINRSNRTRFDAHDGALLSTLLPSLQRALNIHRRLAGAELMAANAMDVLDRLPHGVVLVSSAGTVLATNRGADAILKARDGLTLEHGELKASTVALTHQIRSQLETAVRISKGTTLDGRSGMLALPRPSRRRPLSLIFAPLPERRTVLTSNPAVAVVFVRDPDATPAPEAAAIRAILGLTPGEAELVRCLVSGLSLEHAAVVLGLQIDTVRKRIKRVFEKTGTHRQGELVSLVLNSVRVG
jgi:DNA-binding CsgD family transcriptional regulator